MLYTAKGTASLVVPLASVLSVATGSWTAALSVAAIFNVIAAVMAIAVLYPVRVHEIKKAGGTVPEMVTATAAPVV
jgi:OFA family oxalate/formate antiporter-like MFS transporter